MSLAKISPYIWEYWIAPLPLFAILWAGFHYWLHFGNTESIVFAVLFGGCYRGLDERNQQTEEREDFIPYQVSIYIHNRRDFLFKYRLAKTEEDWKQFCEETTEESMLHRGLNFTVLSLNKEGQPHLIWWNDHQVFRVGIPSFQDSLQGTNISSQRVFWPSLYFGFRHGSTRGYNLVLCVMNDWWEKNKTENIEAITECNNAEVYLVLGTLPYGELGLDYESRQEDRKTELEKLGWTIKDIEFGEYIRVQNEYFTVSQQWCNTA